MPSALPSLALPYDRDAAVGHLGRVDAALAAHIERVGPFTLAPRPLESVFTALLRSIVYQQLSGKAAATIYGRVCGLYAKKGAQDAPPTPEQILETPDDVLRGAGLSRPKTAAAKDLAGKALEGVIPSVDALHAMEDAEIVRRLTQVRGIGPWTVEMLLIFWLGRPDVLPSTDLGVRRGFMQVYGLDELPPPAEVAAHGDRWQPYRSVAAWYLWRAADGTF